MIKLAMDAGKHVFCEKPLADTVEKCKEAEAIIAAHPDLIFMLGFMRRYDHSYQVAKKKMENGDIGDVILVRCYSQDRSRSSRARWSTLRVRAASSSTCPSMTLT